MALTLAQYEAQVSALLGDVSHALFSTAVMDAALRQVLTDYTNANPLQVETVITLPAAGREIALSTLTGLLQVTDVWWKYVSTGSEMWPPVRVNGWRLWWDDGAPVLFFNRRDETQPQSADGVRIWYTKAHTIQNLDSASTTTPLAPHEQMIVRGAAGLCALARAKQSATKKAGA